MKQSSRKFDFLPLTLRIETLGEIATPLVLRGTPLPATRSDEFATAADGQVSVEVKLLMGESPLARKNLDLGTFHLKEIPSQGAGEAKVLVEYSVDKTCAVTARATLAGSENRAEHTFPAPEALSDDFIAKVLAEAESSQTTDQAELNRVEAANRARALIRDGEQQLKQRANGALSEAIAALGLALSSGDTAKIRAKSDALQRLIRPYSPLSFFDFTDVFGFKPTPTPQPKPVTARPNSRSRTDHAASPKDGLKTPLSQLGKIFGGGSFTLDPQLCFVLMPFDPLFQPIYEDHIQPAVQRVGLRCERADEIHGPTLITWDIWERINRARFLIADVTGRNPNVFYELGLAHAISKDVILLTQSGDSVPFDISGIRFLQYDFTPRGAEILEKKLIASIDAVMRSS